MPFIHGSIHHLFSNSVPLFVMLFMILFFYKRVAFSSIMLIYLLTGIGVWAFARSHVYHIGASGVVYGLVSFVFWSQAKAIFIIVLPHCNNHVRNENVTTLRKYLSVYK